MPDNLPLLYYPSEKCSNSLPEWACFFVRLGYQLATMPKKNYRIVTGLAVPTRAFASSLTATGVVFATAGNTSSTDTMQIQYIRGLKPGTAVHVHLNNNKKLRGVVKNLVVYNGRQYILIRTTESMERGFPIEEYATRITVAESNVNLPKHQQSGYAVETPTKFLQCCLGEKLAETFILNSSFEALLIGSKSVLRHEICDIPFICKASGKSTGTTGCLQEILRVRQFSGANKSYRSQCVSPLNITPEIETGKQTPTIVIFDGAIAYIKLGHQWRSAHQIVLLDRTERQFVDAVELLNQNYAYRLPGVSELPINIPSGIEMMVHRENTQ